MLGQAKVAVKVESEQELDEIAREASRAGLVSYLVVRLTLFVVDNKVDDHMVKPST